MTEKYGSQARLKLRSLVCEGTARACHFIMDKLSLFPLMDKLYIKQNGKI